MLSLVDLQTELSVALEPPIAPVVLCAKLRRILRKYGYLSDSQEKATQTMLEQAELLCEGWAA